jgi:transcriptional antiterminator
MKLTTPQEVAFRSLKEEIVSIRNSSAVWGIALIGPNGLGKSTVVRELTQQLHFNDIRFVYLNLDIPVICPEGKCVNWDEFMKKVQEISPDLDFSEVGKIESFSGRIAKISLILKEAKKRLLIILDHLEECRDWREARWPLDENIADIILISDNYEWASKEQDRVVTSLFQKKIYLDRPLDYDKDEEIFIETIRDRFSIPDEEIKDLFMLAKSKASKGEVLTWWDIFREADKMED